MAAPQWRLEKPGMLPVPVGTTAARVAAVAAGGPAETAACATSEGRTTRPFAGCFDGAAGPVPTDSPGTDRRCGTAPAVSAVPGSLSLPRLSRAVWGATALLGTCGTTGVASAGGPAVHQRRLAHGAARPIHWME